LEAQRERVIGILHAVCARMTIRIAGATLPGKPDLPKRIGVVEPLPREMQDTAAAKLTQPPSAGGLTPESSGEKNR
jgi:hypothetical protein